MNNHVTPIDSRERLSRAQARDLAINGSLAALMHAARTRRDVAHGDAISYSRKVFIPLTHLCRDVCHYCTFATPPVAGVRGFMTADQILDVARAGRAAGCREALFTLGDKPELRYKAARDELAALGHATTISYLAAMADLVLRETGLLPHLNPGLLEDDDFVRLRNVSVSMGIMLETTSERLSAKGGPHYGSPDKQPAVRLQTIERAGQHGVPLTSGLLIGIGETREERIEALFALRDLHDRYGHIQEIIIQNFCPKTGTRMADAAGLDLTEHLWTIAIARLIFEPGMNIQAPPNLRPHDHQLLIGAGINDWGGVSPITPDFVNPEAPWPHIDALASATAAGGKRLVERLALYPAYARHAGRWTVPAIEKLLLPMLDADGWPREDGWCAGRDDKPPTALVERVHAPAVHTSHLRPLLSRAANGKRLGERDIVRLFRARGADFTTVCRAADELRQSAVGDDVTYIVTRNINYSNVCYFKCGFCAFSKGKTSEHLRGRPYDLSSDEIARRVGEAWRRGATEVCMQGGIHPDYTGAKYLELCGIVKAAAPEIHMHAFSPLEVFQGAQTLRISVDDFLAELKRAGLKSLPGTAAEILDDDVRQHLCPDKIRTRQWLDVMRSAHRAGLRSTATIMFGHIDRYEHWARHLLHVRDLQAETGGFTEFVPLPFVHMESPIYLKGRSRLGPSYRETILMHAIARLALNSLVPNIQASWVKLGSEGVAHLLDAGVNDLGGTLMDESISRAAGAAHGQEMTPQMMEAIAIRAGRRPLQRNTLYGAASEQQRQKSFEANETVA